MTKHPYFPKPNKDTDNGTSYRPISILSVIAKTLEKSLLPYIMHAQIHDTNSFPRVYLHHLNFICFYVLQLLYTSSVEAMYSGQNTYFHTLCRLIGLFLMCILLGNYVIYIMLIAICFIFRRIHVPLMRRSALEALSSVHVSKLSYISVMRVFELHFSREHGEIYN